MPDKSCPRAECGAVMDGDVCHSCGYGAQLSTEPPDPENSRLFDEWFFSVPREIMEMYGEDGSVLSRFDQWLEQKGKRQ